MKHRSFSWFRRLKYRLYAGFVTRPQRKDLGFAIVCLLLYSVIYLPIGLSIGFLHWQPEPNPWQWFNVMLAALIMPGLSEELVYRVILIPHPTEPIGPIFRQRLIFLSWILFLLAHFHPGSPTFFHQPPFLIGAGLLGILCTLSYLQSRSIWMPMFIHWTIVVNWLLIWGGLEKFSR
jgi:predicted Abi (CAAX) family protease